MNHSRKISIYRINKSYFIVPSWYDNGGSLGIHPIRQLDVDCSLSDFGKNILLAVSDCKEGDTDYSQNSWKELLKITKARSQSKLVKNAKLTTLKFLDNKIEYMLSRPDDSKKYFVGSPKDMFESISKISPKELAANTIKSLNDEFRKEGNHSFQERANESKPEVIELRQEILNDKDSNLLYQELLNSDFLKFIDSNSVINEIFKSYNEDRRIYIPFSGLNRIITIDAESLFEAGGYIELIQRIKPLMEKLQIKFEIGEDDENFDEDKSRYTERWVMINNTKYEMIEVSNWESAFKSGFKIINKLLVDNQFDGKLYGLIMDETSVLIILNVEQFRLISNVNLADENMKPIDLEEIMN